MRISRRNRDRFNGHRPDYVVCTCGARVPWGSFDDHHRDATHEDARRGFAYALREIPPLPSGEDVR